MKGFFIGLVLASAVAVGGYFMDLVQFDCAKAVGFFNSGMERTMQVFNAYF